MSKESVQAQINIHLAWANYHVASTLNGISISRHMQRGDKDSPTGWRDMSDAEKIRDSMNCAESHLHHAHDLIDALN